MEMILERGINLDNSNIYRWLQKFTSQLEAAFRKGGNCAADKSWRLDETDIKVKSQWKDLSRTVDKHGRAIDVLLTAHHDKKAALRFFLRTRSGNSACLKRSRSTRVAPMPQPSCKASHSCT